MKTQELLKLEPGTELAIVVGRLPKELFGGVPPAASLYKLRGVRENGRYTKVVTYQTQNGHDYDFEFAPRDIYGTYEQFRKARATADVRVSELDKKIKDIEKTRKARLDALEAYATKCGVTLNLQNQYNGQVTVDLDALEALLLKGK